MALPGKMLHRFRPDQPAAAGNQNFHAVSLPKNRPAEMLSAASHSRPIRAAIRLLPWRTFEPRPPVRPAQPLDSRHTYPYRCRRPKATVRRHREPAIVVPYKKLNNIARAG